ncbi:unnamed protein product, partial [Effrenium voratum]
GVHLRLLRGCGGLREALWARGAGGWPGTVRGVSGAPGENVGADGFGERLSGGAAERPGAVPGASAGAPPATQP